MAEKPNLKSIWMVSRHLSRVLEYLHDAIHDANLLEQRDMEEIGEQAAEPEAEEGGEGDGGD